MSLSASDRRIRVFISSTFRDMHEEREVLVKRIFPQLRKLCEERAVSWTEVDLRWGITSEQAAEGKVLPLCLAEIQRCRPYFIGLLGERYGWVPESQSLSAELLESEPWLREHLGSSVTEMEILHGVFNRNEMRRRAYFYFRDPKYLSAVPSDKLADFTVEDSAAAEKLANLKRRIRSARDEQACRLREGYSDPEQLGDWVLEDFTELIDQCYPQLEAPSPSDRETSRHEAYARTRRLAFVGREDILRRMDDLLAASASPADAREGAEVHGAAIVLTGESGCGKSTLLAEWAARRREEHADDVVIEHYVGSTADGADWRQVVLRILGQLKHAFAIAEEVPAQPDALRDALHRWTRKAAGSRLVVVAIDALNQLAEEDAARLLGWLPQVFPANFRILVSTLPGVTLEVLQQRDWPVIEVPLFTAADVAAATLAYFQVFSKTLPADVAKAIESTQAARNPLFLRSVLDELRQFGNSKELRAKADAYLSAADLPALFVSILTRWDDDFGKNPNYPDLVRRSLCLVALSRFGLAETELLDLLGKAGNPLPRRPWTPFLLAAEGAMVLRNGLLNFGHQHLQAAVEKRWLQDPATVRAFQEQIADYFTSVGEPTERKLDELPRLLDQLQAWQRQIDLLTQMRVFREMRRRDRWKEELHHYWTAMASQGEPSVFYSRVLNDWVHHSGGDGPGFLMASFSDDPGGATKDFELLAGDITKSPFLIALNELVNFYRERGNNRNAEPLLRQLLEIEEFACRDRKDDPELAASLNNLAAVLHDKDQFDEAEELLRRAVGIVERAYGADDPRITRSLDGLASVLKSAGKLVEAETLARRALKIATDRFGPLNLQVADGLQLLSSILRTQGRLAESERLLRKSLDAFEQVAGKESARVSHVLSELALLLARAERHSEAEPFLRRALAINERLFGVVHPQVATNLEHLGVITEKLGDAQEAERLKRRALDATERFYGAESRETADALHMLSVFLRETRRPQEAESLARRALAVAERYGGGNESWSTGYRRNLAVALADQGRWDEAKTILHRALEIDEAAHGSRHHDVAHDLHLLGQTSQKTNPDEAIRYYRRALAIREELNGPDHPSLVTELSDLGWLLLKSKQFDAADECTRRALEIDERRYGSRARELLNRLHNRYVVLDAAGRLAEAESVVRRAVEICEKSAVPDPLRLADFYESLGLILLQRENFAESESYLRKALAIQERRPGSEAQVTSIATALASVLDRQGRHAESSDQWQRVLTVQESEKGEEHMDVAQDLYLLGEQLRQARRDDEAEPHYRRALAIAEKLKGPNDFTIGSILNGLALSLTAKKRYTEAEPFFRRALTILETWKGPDDVDLGCCMFSYSSLLQNVGRLEEAELLMRQALKNLLHFLNKTGRRHHYLQNVLNGYADLLELMGRNHVEIVCQLNAIGLPFGLQFGPT